MSTATLKVMTFATVTATGRATGDEAEMVISTGSVDRDKDRVIPEGVVLENFRRNPPLLWNHDPGEVPIGTVTQIAVEPGQGLRARWRWSTATQLARDVKAAWDEGVVRAASIGFMPLAKEPNGFGGVDFIRWELFEVSLVSIPANPEAVRRLKALGLGARPLSADAIADDIVRRALPVFEGAGIVDAIRDGVREGMARYTRRLR